MEYAHDPKTADNTPQTLSGYMHEMALYSAMDLSCIAEIKAARSFLENI